MRYLVSGRLRAGCGLSPAECFVLAVREWALLLEWIADGRALGYGRPAGPGQRAVMLDAASEAEAEALARRLPFAPYVDLAVALAALPSVRRAPPPPPIARPG